MQKGTTNIKEKGHKEIGEENKEAENLPPLTRTPTPEKIPQLESTKNKTTTSKEYFWTLIDPPLSLGEEWKAVVTNSALQFK